MLVCIDPGHGGYDPGAIGPKGTKEKDITLAISRLIAIMLADAGLECYMTRSGDETKDLVTRSALANNMKCAVLVSIHCNAGSATAKGMEIYTTKGVTQGDKLADSIIQAWRKQFPQGNIREDLSDGDGDKEENFWMLRATKMPAVLVETAFISNPEEEQLLKDSQHQGAIAQAITEGILNYVGKPREGKAAMGHPPINQQGILYVPLRGFLAATGVGEVESWEQSKQEAVISLNGKKYSLAVGSDVIKKVER